MYAQYRMASFYAPPSAGMPFFTVFQCGKVRKSGDGGTKEKVGWEFRRVDLKVEVDHFASL